MEAKLTVYADHTRNKISRNLFGHFMEHCEDIIYGGVFDPGHPSPMRTDSAPTCWKRCGNREETPVLRLSDAGGGFWTLQRIHRIQD